MSIFKSIKKLVKGVAKMLPYIAAAFAVVYTGGAALGAMGAAGAGGAAAGSAAAAGSVAGAAAGVAPIGAGAAGAAASGAATSAATAASLATKTALTTALPAAGGTAATGTAATGGTAGWKATVAKWYGRYQTIGRPFVEAAARTSAAPPGKKFAAGVFDPNGKSYADYQQSSAAQLEYDAIQAAADQGSAYGGTEANSSNTTLGGSTKGSEAPDDSDPAGTTPTRQAQYNGQGGPFVDPSTQPVIGNNNITPAYEMAASSALPLDPLDSMPEYKNGVQVLAEGGPVNARSRGVTPPTALPPPQPVSAGPTRYPTAEDLEEHMRPRGEALAQPEMQEITMQLALEIFGDLETFGDLAMAPNLPNMPSTKQAPQQQPPPQALPMPAPPQQLAHGGLVT